MRFHLFFILFPLLLFSQSKIITLNDVNIFNTIKDGKSLSIEVKEKKIDSLLSFYKTNKDSLLYVNTLYKYAKWQHIIAKNTDRAIDISIHCLSVIEDLKLQKLEYEDYIIYNRTINNLNYFYKKKGDYYNAYKTSKKISTIRPIDEDVIKAYSLSAKYLTFLGDFYKGAEHYEEAIKFAYSNNDIEAVIRSSNDASICYKKIGGKLSLNRGIELLENAIRLTGKIKDIEYSYIFNLYEQLGNLYNEREDYDFENSKKNYDKALSVAIKNNDSKLIPAIYIDLSYLYIHTKNDIALSYIEKALKYNNNDNVKSLIYANKSLYYYKTEKLEKALESIQNSINFISPVSTENFEDNPSKEDAFISMYKYDLLSRLISKSKIWLAYYEKENKNKSYLINALETLKLADFLVDEIRLDSKDQQSKLFWRKEASDIYTNAVKACFALNNPEEAFYFMEKNKAILLLEDLREERLKESINFPQNIRDKQLNLEANINNLKVLLNKNNKLKDSVIPYLTKAKEEYYNYIDNLESQYPLLYRSQKKPLVLSLNQAKKTVNNNTVYIEYILNKENVFGLFISNSKIELFEIKNHTVFFDNLNHYKRLLSNPLNSPQDVKDFYKIGNVLYQSLFPKQITDLIKNKELIIIPDYSLQEIPFEALTNNKEYLIKNHEISYAYSISFLEQNQNKTRANKKEFIGFAPINFKTLDDLPETEEEIVQTSKLFSSKTFQLNDATTRNLIDNIKDCSIIHIASHANANNSDTPYIVFSDKKFYLDDIYLTKNTADLVVLSGCSTSLGTLNEGEGIMSLSRGFFNTGANSVLSTLWNINDKTSSKIIIDFYKHLKNGETKSRALRLSKLKYLETHQLGELSPHYWASFVLIGDSKNISGLKNYTSLVYVSILLILSLITLLVYLKTKK